MQTIDEAPKVIQFIRQQYADYGIGRWAVIEKDSGCFIGWSGLKFITEAENNRIHFYDVGYRSHSNSGARAMQLSRQRLLFNMVLSK